MKTLKCMDCGSEYSGDPMGARLKTDLEIAEEALAKWPTATMGILRTGIRDDLLLPAIAAAREEGRAAGYAEAIEASMSAVRKWAANYPVDVFPEPGVEPCTSDIMHASWARHTCEQIEREISELAPAATTKELK